MRREIREKLSEAGIAEGQWFLLRSDGLKIGIFDAEDYLKIRHLGGLRGNSLEMVTQKFVEKNKHLRQSLKRRRAKRVEQPFLPFEIKKTSRTKPKYEPMGQL